MSERKGGRAVTATGKLGEVAVEVFVDSKGRHRCRAKGRYRNGAGKLVQAERTTPVSEMKRECFDAAKGTVGRRAIAALEAHVASVASVEGDGDIAPTSKLSALLDAYVEDRVAGEGSKYSLRSRGSYQRAARILRPRLGDLRLNEVKVSKLSRIVGGVVDDHGHQTARLGLTLLRAVYRDAVRDGAVERNIARDVELERPKARKSETRFLTPEQLAWLLDALETSEVPIAKRKGAVRETTRTVAQYVNDVDILEPITLLAATGLRRSELFGLVWDDFDESGEVPELRIRHHVVRASATGEGPTTLVHEEATKNGEERRVALTPEVATMLRRRRMRVGGGPAAEVRTAQGLPDVIFASPVTGRLRDAEAFARSWRIVCRALGCEDVNLHLFRSTVGTFAAEALGVRAAAALLGHRTIDTTSRHYVGVKSDPLVADVMGAAMRGEPLSHRRDVG